VHWNIIIRTAILPIEGAFIGWITTYLAILMIFRPRNPIKILGLTIQGIVPKKRHEIAMSIGRSVERDMISFDDFQDLIKDVDLDAEVGKIIDKYIDEKIASAASERSFVGRTYNSVVDNVKDRLKAYLAREISTNANNIIKSFAQKVETEFDIQEIVAKRIDNYDVETLENVVFGFTKREFKFLEVMGGVFGFIIGCAQAVFFLLFR
jgi:uncharacterized membrane protein YheB (UPF0754 family)